MKKIGVGIIGAGWWATECHLPELKRHLKAETLVVQRRDSEKRDQIARAFDIPNAVETLDEALCIPGLQAVVIASTPNMHFAQAKAAIERGLHVLIEKPMTMTLHESEELLKRAHSKGVQFLVSCPFHYAANSIALREMLREKRFGRIHLIQMHYTNFTRDLMAGRDFMEIFGGGAHDQISGTNSICPGAASYSDPAVAGGGQIYCQMSHVAAHLGFLFDGEPWTELFARFDNGGTHIDVTNLVNLKMRESGVCNITCSGLPMLSGRQYEVRIYGSKGMVLTDFYTGSLEWHDAKPERHIFCERQDHTDTYPMFAPVRNLVDVIAGDATNGSPAELGVYAMRLIEEAVRSANGAGNIISES